MFKPLPEEVHKTLLRAVRQHGSYDANLLFTAVKKKLKKLGYTQKLTHPKVRYAFTDAWIINRFSEDSYVSVTTITDELLKLHVPDITRSVVESRVNRLRRVKRIKPAPQTNEKYANKGTQRERAKQATLRELSAAANTLVEQEIPRTKQQAHKALNQMIPHHHFHDEEVNEALVMAFMRSQLGRAIQTASDRGLGLTAFKEVADIKQPEWIVKLAWDARTGHTEAPNIPPLVLPGVFRIPLDDKKLKRVRSIPTSSYQEPLHLGPKRKKGRVHVGVFNGLHFGHVYEGAIPDNLLRKAVSCAQHRGLDALVLGGGLFLPDFRRASGSRNRTLESLLTGYRLDVEDFPEWYQDKVREVVQSGLKEPIYIAAEQMLRSLIRGMHKVLISPQGPEFDGPIYVVFGQREQNLITAIAFFELHYLHVLNVHEAATKLRIAQTIGEDGEAIEQAALMKSLTAKSNLHQTVERNVLELATKALVKLIEHDSGIPNLHIIGHNEAHVRFGAGQHVVHFTSQQGGDTLEKVVREYGPVERNEELADLIWVFDPASTQYREVVRENWTSSGRSATLFAQGPIFVDEEVIRERIGPIDIPGRQQPILKALKDPYFQPGFSILHLEGNLPISIDFVRTSQIRNSNTDDEVIHKMTRTQRRKKITQEEKYFRIVLATDIHVGNPNRRLMERADGRIIGTTEGYFELVRASGMHNGETPFESVFLLDDLTHGNHFGTHKSVHQERLPVNQFQGLVEQLRQAAEEQNDPDDLRALLNDALHQLERQRHLAGEHELTSQLHSFRRNILCEYADVWQGVLKRFESSGAQYLLMGDVQGDGSWHSTDIGAISSGSGNHATKTTDGMFLEGVSLMDYLRALLTSPDPKQMKADIERLDRLIKSHTFQQQSIGYGRLDINGVQYAFELNSSPAKMSGWADVLKGVARAELFRGNPSGIMSGVPVIRFYGDKHFHGFRVTPRDVFVMGAPDTVTDSFAYMAGGLPPTVPGVTVLCLPEAGLDAAPVMTRFLDAYTIEEWLQRPSKFPWQEWHLPGL